MQRTRTRAGVTVVFAFLAAAAAARAQTLDLPADKIAGGKPAGMMSRYWQRQAEQAFARWQADYDRRKSPDQIAAYQKRLRAEFLAAIGGLPERTPLRPQVTGVVQREGYRVEKVVFESQPRHFVTAILFLPDAARFKPPYPGVIVPCGHAMKAKGHEEYQSVAALLALSGMAALVFDPIDQGERGQYLGPEGWPKLWGTGAHSLLGVGSTLLGRNTAGFEIWDGMRAIDYLQSRPEIDGKRIGCTGNSGGGTQTSYLMALDDRIAAAAPSCYLCGFPALLRTIGPQDAEQNIFGQLAFGMDHADYLMMRAPTPILLCAATKDFFDIRGTWEIHRQAKRLYSRMGFAERLDLLENDAEHNYNRLQREGVVRWMARWLLGKDQPISEPPLVLLSEKEYQCTPEGQVMLLPGARSVYDLNEEEEARLAIHRAERWKASGRSERLDRVRQIAGIRKLADLPLPKVHVLAVVQRPGYRVEQFVLEPEEQIALPALVFWPEKRAGSRLVLYVHEEGKSADAGPGGPIEAMVRDGSVVVAVDLRGTGQTRPAGSESNDVFTAYLLGRSYVGLRAEDVLIAARFGQGIDLVAVGRAGIPALHAAALEPGLFQSVTLRGAPASWSGVVRSRLTKTRLADVVHGALREYDLTDLAASLGPKLTIEEPADAKVIPVGVAKVDITPGQPVRMYGYGARKTESEGVAGRLKAAALALGSDADDGPAVLLTVDCGAVPADICREVLRRVRARTPLKPERLMIANSHNHSGPDLKGMGSMSGEERRHLAEYAKELTGKLEEVVLKALSARKPGRLAWTTGSVGFAANRRVLKDGKWTGFGAVPEGAVDHGLPLLRVTDAQGKLLAVVVNYACHNTTLRGDFKQIHGDWAACAQESIEADHPGAVAMVTVGCGADADPYPHGTVELCRRHGRAVADEVKRLLAGPLKPIEPTISARSLRLEIPYEPAPPLEQLKELAKKSYPAERLLKRLERGEKPPASESYQIAAWVFGNDLAMLFLSDEVVVDYALRLKRELDGSRLWVNAYSNDVSTYIVSKRLIGEGGYEVNNSLSGKVTYGRPERLQPAMEDRIVQSAKDLLPAGFRSGRTGPKAEKPR